MYISIYIMYFWPNCHANKKKSSIWIHIPTTCTLKYQLTNLYSLEWRCMYQDIILFPFYSFNTDGFSDFYLLLPNIDILSPEKICKRSKVNQFWLQRLSGTQQNNKTLFWAKTELFGEGCWGENITIKWNKNLKKKWIIKKNIIKWERKHKLNEQNINLKNIPKSNIITFNLFTWIIPIKNDWIIYIGIRTSTLD